MERISEYNTNHLTTVLQEAERAAIATIDYVYQDIHDESHATCEEIHAIKKSLQCLLLIHQLKQIAKV